MPQDVHDLIMWQRAAEPAVSIYKLTQQFPKEEIHGVPSQMRRASVSVINKLRSGNKLLKAEG